MSNLTEYEAAVNNAISQYYVMYLNEVLIKPENEEQVRERALLLLALHTAIDSAIREGTTEMDGLLQLRDKLNDVIALHNVLLQVYMAEPSGNTAEPIPEVVLPIETEEATQEMDSLEETTCPICYNDDNIALIEVNSSCHHHFCVECVQHYLQTSLASGNLISIHCPHPRCQSEISYEIMSELMDYEWCAHYEELAVKALMRMDSHCKWCPKPGCETPVIVEGDLNSLTCPNCRYKYCPKCSGEDHPNISCQNFANWRTSNASGDSKFNEWVNQNEVKNCPKCKIFTQKNKGCNHMTCVSCRFQWCWLCLGQYNADHFSTGACSGKQFYKSDMSPNVRDPIRPPLARIARATPNHPATTRSRTNRPATTPNHTATTRPATMSTPPATTPNRTATTRPATMSTRPVTTPNRTAKTSTHPAATLTRPATTSTRPAATSTRPSASPSTTITTTETQIRPKAGVRSFFSRISRIFKR